MLYFDMSAILGLLFIASFTVPASAVTLDTADGLRVTFSDVDGSVTAVSVNGSSIPLVPAEPGGLSVRVGNPTSSQVLQHLDFNSGAGPVTSAHNASWDGSGSYVTWLPNGGIDDSGHLLLGNGVADGSGMAMSSPIAVWPGSNVRISWQARSASTATTHILCVRIYNALGEDITSTSNLPNGWNYTGASLAHAVWGFGCSQPNAWEQFERFYQVSTDAAYIRVSLRHWTGGDRLLHIDDFSLQVVGGIGWSQRTPVLGPVVPAAGGFTQSVALAGLNLRVDTAVEAADGRLEVQVALQDTSAPPAERAVQLHWILPVQAAGGRWWDDIDAWRQIAPGAVYRNTFDYILHPVSRYPFSSITSDDFGLSLMVPQDGAMMQRFEYDTAVGLSCVWEIGLSPVTTKLGAGRASASMSVSHHDPAWGFRAAADRYYGFHPDDFTKRSTREGAWMYPIHPSQIPDPLDFGFAFHETFSLSEQERNLCNQLDIGIFYYTEPWLAWQEWGTVSGKPPYEERVARLEEWATESGAFTRWVADGGVNNTGHLLLGDGSATGSGMATTEAFDVGAGPVNIRWQMRVADVETLQILCVRLYDAAGSDITESTPAPSGWGWSGTSQAHFVAGIANANAQAWESFSRQYVVPAAAKKMRVSLRHWNGGDHWVQIDDLRVESAGGGVTYLAMDFNVASGDWLSALQSDWENAGPLWLRVPRRQSAQAVINSSPLDADGRYFIDASSYFWHEWGGEVGSWNQAWPLNPDPDLPSPSTFELHASDNWIYNALDQNAGVYIDSVITRSVSIWENRRPDHLAVADRPLTFSWEDGGAAQTAAQAQAEMLEAVAQEVRGRGKLMMLNIFPDAMRFHHHRGDVLGSEVSELVESQSESRMRRTLARHRVVSNLLQRAWSSSGYMTYAEMERFIRGQMFWGFYPAVSSAGGAVVGGGPDRYFLHPELYERDRPLFKFYVPVVRSLSSAGWEPVTHATVANEGEAERFGDFSRGPVYLRVRGHDEEALQSEVTLDLGGCGLQGALHEVESQDVLADQPLDTERLAQPDRLRFLVSLAAGEVGVYRFQATASAGADFDHDGDVDQADFGHFQICVTGARKPQNQPECQDTRLDEDDDVDDDDFSILFNCYSGPNQPADPDCTG